MTYIYQKYNKFDCYLVKINFFNAWGKIGRLNFCQKKIIQIFLHIIIDILYKNLCIYIFLVSGLKWAI